MPYRPSWVDRLTKWVDTLPGPPLPYYLGAALTLVLISSGASWSDGSYPVGTFFPFHVLDASNSVYLLFVLYYLDKQADAALAALRPALTVDDAEYERLRYQLTTLPALPAFLWSFGWFILGIVYLPVLVSDAQRLSLKMFTSPTVIAVDYFLSALNWMMNGVFAYHTIRQLRLVSRIYTQYTKINVFDTGPLYSLSRVTAITTLALLLISNLYFAFWVEWSFERFIDLNIAIAFILLALVSFVWPLWGVHRLLRDQKARRRGEIARRMEKVTDELHRCVDAGDYGDMTNLNLTIDSLNKEQSALEKISTWPWEPETARVMVTALLLPIGLWIITRILERLGL